MEIIRNKNSKKYRPKVYIQGKSITKVFERKADAEKWARLKIAEKERIEVFNQPIIEDITFEEFTNIWLTNKCDLANRTIDSYKSVLNLYLIPKVGQLKLKMIRIQHAQVIISELLKKELGTARINFMIVFFKQLLNDAIKWDYLLYHPLKNLKKLKLKPVSESYWMSHEVQTFLNEAKDNPHYALFVTALNTGMRRGELLGLCWDKVDFENRRIEVSRIKDRYELKNTTKTGKIVFIPMNDIAFKVLSDLKKENRHSQFVFVSLNGSEIDLEHISNRIFKKAIVKANVRPIKFHNLRSTFAANFCMNGGNVYTLSKILNHSSVDMTSQKYAHLHSSYLLNEIQKISFEARSP